MLSIRNLLFALTLPVLALTSTACTDDDAGTDDGVQEVPVLEIAVRRVKPGQEEAFSQARADFIALLRQQEGVLIDREYQAILDFQQQPVEGVYVGMTQYTSLDTFDRIAQDIGNSPEAQAFFATFDAECFLPVEAYDSQALDLAGLGIPGNVVELAIRNVKAGQLDTFNSSQANFVELLDGLNGVLGSREYTSLTTDQRIGTTVYQDSDALASAAQTVLADANTATYFGSFDLACYYFLSPLAAQ